MMKKTLKVLTMALCLIMLLTAVSCKNQPTKDPDQSDKLSNQSDKLPSEETTPSSAQEEIIFWHSYSEGEEAIFNDVVLKAFHDAHPEIKVNAIRMPYEGMNEQLVTAVSGNAGPDVMRMDLTWVSQMAKLGVLEKLDDYEGFKELAAQIVPGSMNTTLYQGDHYGLPLNANTTVAVFNKEVMNEYGFDSPPETLDALLAAKDKTDPASEKWLFAVSGSYNWAMLPFIWTLGGSVTDDNYVKATGYLNSEATIQALETIVEWYKEDTIGPAIMGEQPDGWGGIEAGNYAMIVEGPWFFSGGGDALDKYVAALIPSVNGKSISIVGGEDIVITKTSSKKEAAWTFVQFMLKDEQQLAMSKAGMIPVTESAMAKVDTSETPYVEVYMKQLQKAEARIPSANWPLIENVLNTAFESVLRDQMSAKEALDKAAADVDALLGE